MSESFEVQYVVNGTRVIKTFAAKMDAERFARERSALRTGMRVDVVVLAPTSGGNIAQSPALETITYFVSWESSGERSPNALM